MMKDLGKIIKELFRMFNNPLTKWAIVIWFTLYMSYLFFIVSYI